MSTITPDGASVMGGPDSAGGPASAVFPPVAPDVVAAAVEGLTSRLRKKLDAAVEQYAVTPVTATDDGQAVIACGPDATVTLAPGPSGTITDPGQATCTCLLAPRCLHRAAVLSACPVADAGTGPVMDTGAATDIGTGAGGRAAEPATTTNTFGTPEPAVPAQAAQAKAVPAPITAAQIAAANGLWAAAASVLAAGVRSAGAVPQAELLRAAHTARLAGLYRAEAAALRVVRGLRSARAHHDGHRLADLTAALRELLLTASLLAAAHPDPALIGTVRRAYKPGSSLRVLGVCREPVISATGYGGVVTHLVSEDGRWLSIADVKPGGVARARGAATAPVAVGGVGMDHAGLARGGLLIAGATVSPDGRLGAGKGVRATPIRGVTWSAMPAAGFGRSLSEAVADRLTADPGAEPESTADRARELIGCDLVIIGPAGDHVLAWEPPTAAGTAGLVQHGTCGAETPGLLVRLTPASGLPDLAHTANLRQLASRPGLRVRVVGRLDPDRAATLVPLAVGPVPEAAATLRLPAEWLERADLGYDRLRGSHFPPVTEIPPPPAVRAAPDPVAGSPLWRVRRQVELAVAGGRRVVAESARAGDSRGDAAALRSAGFRAAAELSTALGAEADRRSRDVFGRLDDPDPHRFASAWLAAALHLAGAEQSLIRATWRDG